MSSGTIGPGETGYWEPNRNKKHGSAAEPSGPEKRGTGSPIETKKIIRNTSQNIGPSLSLLGGFLAYNPHHGCILYITMLG